MLEINLGSDSDSIIELNSSYLKNSYSRKDKNAQKKSSIMASQTSFENITRSSFDDKVYLISSKFMAREVPIITILKIKATTKNVVAL